jgi:hypothetical protein
MMTLIPDPRFWRRIVGGLQFFGVVMAIAPFPLFAAGSISASSGPHTIALLELYTSEGCSSCPPVDRYVSEISRKGPGPDHLVTLAFHVDYWDRLGWKDAYARREYTTRQRSIARRSGYRSVYTPQLVFDGRDFPRRRNIEDATRLINAVPARAKLRIEAGRGEGATLQLAVAGRVLPPEQRRKARAYLALYENNIERHIGAGENRGRVLHHDRVVHSLIGPASVDSEGNLRLERQVKLDAQWKTADLGVVAFVQNTKSGSVLQAVELPLAPLFRAAP